MHLKTLTRVYQTTALLLLNTVVLLLIVEGCSSIVLALRPHEPTLAEQVEAFKQEQLQLTYYQMEDWSRAYWDEHMQVVDHWQYTPYTIWRTIPFVGQYINVDQNGVRVTPGSNCSAESYRIFMFGGSAMWSYGVPDANTIPANLQAGLPANVCVVNYADTAFNSTQSLLQLIGLLQAGDMPDMVIFYDGSNDVAAANRTSLTNGHFYYAQISDAVNGNVAYGDPEAPEASPLRALFAGTATYRLLLGEPLQVEPDTWAQPPFAEGFVDGVVRTYLTNIETAYLLSQEYGFAFYAFVQPVLPMNESPLTDEEQMFMFDLPGGLAELFREVYPFIRDQAPDYVHYFGDLLDGQQQYVMWIDFNHLTAWGNLAVAAEILNVIEIETGES